MDLDNLAKLLVPAIVPVVSAAVAFVKERTERRQALEVIKRESARIAFWRSYFEALSLVTKGESLEPIRLAVSAELEGAAAAVRAAHAHESAQGSRFRRPTSHMRNFLLLYRPPRPWVWFLRIFFYYYLAYSVLAAVMLPLRWSERGSVLTSEVVTYLIVVAAVALLWILIRYTEDALGRQETNTDA